MSLVGVIHTRVVHTQGHIDGLLQSLEEKEGLEYKPGGVNEMVVVELMRLEIPRVCTRDEFRSYFGIDVELRAVATSQRRGRMEVNLATYEAFPF